MAKTTDTKCQVDIHLYHCSACNINFPSIQDHINNCHKGQEVVFQVCYVLNYIINVFKYISMHR